MLRSLLFAAAAPPRHRPARPDEARYQAADPASGPPPPATTGYRPDPGGPRSPRFRIGRSAKWALVLAAAVFIFRRVIASVVLTALAATLHFLGLNVHLPSVRFAWPWQTITAGTTTNTDLGPWVLQKIEGISRPALGQANFTFVFTHKVSKSIGIWPCWYASTFYAVGHASATVDLNPGPAWWTPGPGALPAPGAEQAAGRAAGAGDGHDDAARPATPGVRARRHDRQPAIQAAGHPAQLDLPRLRLRRAGPAAVRPVGAVRPGPADRVLQGRPARRR